MQRYFDKRLVIVRFSTSTVPSLSDKTSLLHDPDDPEQDEDYDFEAVIAE